MLNAYPVDSERYNRISIFCFQRANCKTLSRRGSHIAFIYAGSHDDCFRWIERNQGMTYKIDDRTYALQITETSSAENNFIPHDDVEGNQRVDEYEAQLMRKIDDKTLRKLFSGFAKIQVTQGN